MTFPSILCTGMLSASAVLFASNAFADPPNISIGVLSTSSSRSCLRSGEDALREAEFHGVDRSVEGNLVFGRRDDYRGAVYCSLGNKAVFVVTGPDGSMCKKYLDAVKNGF
jgi:hypothetical protein